jgi:RNA polymerase sigma-70 factor (ECF subfamily)
MTRQPLEKLPAGREPAADPDLPAVAAAQADPAQFAVLYERYVDLVYSYAFYQLGDHHDAEDATERTFLAALRAIGSFSDRGASFRAWLLRIARNTSANSRRSRFRLRRRNTRLDALVVDPPTRDAGPEAVTVRADELRRVRRALRELPEDRRQVVILRFTEGLSTREISQVLDRSEGAVRVLLHRALRDLAERLPS